MDIEIKKNTGEIVLFDPIKLKESLIRSGASLDDAYNISKEIESKIDAGMTTHKIYRLAYQMLKKRSQRVAGRYKLKKAIFELGPTGYPFEKLISELIKLEGYETQSGITLQGKCVSHEVDVYARSIHKSIFTECKFHNEANRKSDVKVSLYVKSRFADLEAAFSEKEASDHKFEGWLVTNTRFTDDAIRFGVCAGLKMISWDYPEKGNLRQLIDRSGFHPITTIKSLTKNEKTMLMDNGVVLCRQLETNKILLQKTGVSNKRLIKIINEANDIINY